MKALSAILSIVGILILLVAVFGRFKGDPGMVVGVQVMNMILVANTVLLLAVLVKLFEKK